MNGPPKLPDILDYYDVLGVNERASYATIERCVKRLQQSHHPDSRRAGAQPSTVIFQNVGIAWDTLQSDGKRARYDKTYPHIRKQWDVYRVNLAKWNDEQRENEQGQARAAARRRKIEEEKVKIENAKQKVLEEKAKEAARRLAKRMEGEKALREQQAKKEEEIRQREEEALRVRERLQEERRRQRLARDEEETRIKADWARAQRERKLAADEEAAARERLRKQQEKLPRPNKDDDTQSAEPTSDESEERQRLARKQRAAEEREALVIAAAQERQARAAQDRLNRQQSGSESLKRPVADESVGAQALNRTKRPRPEKELSSSLKKHMAREHARRKHNERLQEVGGLGNEHRLRDETIDLGWEPVEHRDQACPQCNTKKSAALFGLWRCPEGGALRCRPCLAALSTFSA